MEGEKGGRSHGGVCAARYAGFLATGLRKPFQDPLKILSPYAKPGSSAVDLGCGPGYFTTALAELVGPSGSVTAVDLQPEMLEATAKRAESLGVGERVATHLCREDRIGLEAEFDFALVFYVLHEVPDSRGFLAQALDLLKPGGRLLVVEPKLHVSARKFGEEIEAAVRCGMVEVGRPKVFFSRTSLLQRPSE